MQAGATRSAPTHVRQFEAFTSQVEHQLLQAIDIDKGGEGVREWESINFTKRDKAEANLDRVLLARTRRRCGYGSRINKFSEKEGISGLTLTGHVRRIVRVVAGGTVAGIAQVSERSGGVLIDTTNTNIAGE